MFYGKRMESNKLFCISVFLYSFLRLFFSSFLSYEKGLKYHTQMERTKELNVILPSQLAGYPITPPSLKNTNYKYRDSRMEYTFLTLEKIRILPVI